MDIRRLVDIKRMLTLEQKMSKCYEKDRMQCVCRKFSVPKNFVGGPLRRPSYFFVFLRPGGGAATSTRRL